MHRLPFHANNNYSHFPFDLIHCDIWGPFHKHTHDNKQYFLTIVDDSTRFTWVHLLKSKSEAPDLIKCFFAFVKTQFDKQIKAIRTDNARELALHSFLQEQGTIHQLSCPHRPQQNSVVERKHQHLLNVARSLYFQSKVPLEFWGECVSTATHLINRLPSPSLKGKSPYELLYKVEPDYSMLRVFGCLAFSSTIPSQRHKFSPRATPCIFMGYPIGVKGYKLLDPTTNKFIISRDVIFCESTFPYHKIHLDPPSQSLFSETLLPHPSDDNLPLSNKSPDITVIPLPVADTIPEPSPIFTPAIPHIDPTPLRRSTRPHIPPARLQLYDCNSVPYPIQSFLNYNNLSPPYKQFVLNISSIFEPQHFYQAVKHPVWQKAMAEELAALESNNTWSIVPLPSGKRPVGCKWVYKIKYHADGTLDRCKARLVAQGFTQQAGIDFLDTFSPVAKLTSVRILLSLASQLNWHLLQLDINNAFLHGELQEEVYMSLPLGYPSQGENRVCRLNKSLYGLRQASRQWFHKFSTTITSLGFQKSTADNSLFTKGSGDTFIALLVYVDDIVVAGPNKDLVSDVQTLLQNHFKLKVIGNLKYFLGLEIARSKGGIHLCQRKYTLQLLMDTGFTSCKPVHIPMDSGTQLNETDGEALQDISEYRRLIGRLIYLTISRPDIRYTVNKLSQFMAKPRTTHLQAAHHLLQYLKTTAGLGIMFPAKSTLKLTAYVDADWGSCLVSRKSTTGYCIYLGEAMVTWRSKKQATVARSSAEAEYRALAAVTSELLWVKQLLRDFEIKIDSTMVLCDSKSAIQLAENPTTHEKSKHIDIDCHFIREYVQSGFLKLIHVKSQQQLADLLTKPLPKRQFSQLVCKLGMKNIYLPNLRGSLNLSEDDGRLEAHSNSD